MFTRVASTVYECNSASTFYSPGNIEQSPEVIISWIGQVNLDIQMYFNYVSLAPNNSTVNQSVLEKYY